MYISELEDELGDSCRINENGNNIEIYLDNPLEEFYDAAVSIAENVLNNNNISHDIDGDYEGHFTIEIYN